MTGQGHENLRFTDAHCELREARVILQSMGVHIDRLVRVPMMALMLWLMYSVYLKPKSKLMFTLVLQKNHLKTKITSSAYKHADRALVLKSL